MKFLTKQRWLVLCQHCIEGFCRVDFNPHKSTRQGFNIAHSGLKSALQGFNHHHNIGRVIIATVLLSFICRSVVAEEAGNTNLTTYQRKQIQTVSQAILASKRMMKPSGESLAIRRQLKQVRAKLDKLTARINTAVTLRLDTERKPLPWTAKMARSVVTLSKTDKQQVWKQARSKRIQQLNSSLGQLKILCDEAVYKRESLQSAAGPSLSGLLQRLKTKFLKSQAKQKNRTKQNSVITSLSNAALTRLSHLQAEIDEVIALPEQERHQRLLSLSKRLQIGQQPSVLADNEENGNANASFNDSTPTLVSRTLHRRKF